jgi:hypothetical protein
MSVQFSVALIATPRNSINDHKMHQNAKARRRLLADHRMVVGGAPEMLKENTLTSRSL